MKTATARHAPKSFPARFPGKCADTGCTINIGDRIERSALGGWCLSGPPGAISRPVRPMNDRNPSEDFDAWLARINAEEDARDARKMALAESDVYG